MYVIHFNMYYLILCEQTKVASQYRKIARYAMIEIRFE